MERKTLIIYVIGHMQHVTISSRLGTPACVDVDQVNLQTSESCSLVDRLVYSSLSSPSGCCVKNTVFVAVAGILFGIDLNQERLIGSSRPSPSPTRSHLLRAAGLSSTPNDSPLGRSFAGASRNAGEVEKSIAELSEKCQELTGQLERLAKNFAREVDERRATENNLKRHVQQQVEEIVKIVKESEAKTEQDVGQALKILRSNLSLQITEASEKHLHRLERKLLKELNTVVEGCSSDFVKRLNNNESQVDHRISRVEALLRKSTDKFTDAIDPIRATVTDLNARVESLESSGNVGRESQGCVSPGRIRLQVMKNVEDRLDEFRREIDGRKASSPIHNHSHSANDAEIRQRIRGIENRLTDELLIVQESVGNVAESQRKISERVDRIVEDIHDLRAEASKTESRQKLTNSELQRHKNEIGQSVGDLTGEVKTLRQETTAVVKAQSQNLEEQMRTLTEKNANASQSTLTGKSNTFDKVLEITKRIEKVEDQQIEMRKALKEDMQNDFEKALDGPQGIRAEIRGVSEKADRGQRELGNMKTQCTELERALADNKERLNLALTNTTKFVTEQIGDLEKRVMENLIDSRSSLMRGFESDLIRITEELDCHVKGVQASSDERMKGQFQIVKEEIESKSAETADRLRRIMSSLMELSLRIEKQEDMLSDPNLQRHIRGLVDEVIQRSMDADRLEHREMISQLYKKMSEVVNAMHYPNSSILCLPHARFVPYGVLRQSYLRYVSVGASKAGGPLVGRV
ncbi:hypothetical protein FOL47_006686 [Perkinsus chesapeaki]|uniref:Uncharacterized protein n=1 Tax=Perkinsus chesapeaki TaxID=330153 RepID=A0A7J6LQ23_PERCH|nr:hypothetical protein FOL47_006686 [Perkinsus chesapeaki]